MAHAFSPSIRLATLRKEIETQNDIEWTKKYYSEEAQSKVEARKPLWSPELQERVSKQWAELFADIEASLGEDPAGQKAQSLAARWKELVAGFTGGDPGIQKGLNAMYADEANWPDGPKSKIGKFVPRFRPSSRRP